jgi:AraC-like DNA-binding protein
MRTVISTKDVHPRHAFDYWHEVFCKKVTEHDCTLDSPRNFHAELQFEAIGDIGVALAEGTPMRWSIAAKRIAHADSENLYLLHHQAGRMVLEQDGCEAVLDPGDFALLDSRRPRAGLNIGEWRALILKFPRRQLEARIGNVQRMIARSIKPSAGERSLTSKYLTMLPAISDGLGPAAANVVRNQALDLVGLSLATAMEGGTPSISSARSVVLMSLYAAIEARLTDATLDAQTVAAAAGVSVRYANAVLADNDTSIMRLVQTLRLERCRRALESESQSRRTVSEIAYGWGFSDMSHFGRRFRAAYGVVPSEYRRRAEFARTRSDAPSE